MKKKNLLIALTTSAVLAITACSKEEPELPMEITVNESGEILKNSSAVNKLIAEVKRATAKYHDVNVALADGFFNSEDCVSGPPGAGAMGIHFVHFERVDGEFNPLEPEVLLYELRDDGTYKLTGVEYLHIGAEIPMFANQVNFHPFPPPYADYALHVWCWKGNPNGIFEDWNVNVSCP